MMRITAGFLVYILKSFYCLLNLPHIVINKLSWDLHCIVCLCNDYFFVNELQYLCNEIQCIKLH